MYTLRKVTETSNGNFVHHVMGEAKDGRIGQFYLVMLSEKKDEKWLNNNFKPNTWNTYEFDREDGKVQTVWF